VEASKLRDKVVYSTENTLAATCLGFRTEIGAEVELPSM